MIATRRRATWLLLLAAALGSFGAYGFFAHMRAYEARLGEMAQVFTVTTEVPLYSPIPPAALRAVRAPRRYLPESAIVDQAAIASQVAAVPLRPGDLITTAVLRSADLGDQRSITLQDQGRGNIFIDATIQTGDRVDVLVAYREKDQDIARYLLTGVLVLRAGEKGERSVSLLVTQDAARELVWMENFGRQIRVVRQG